MIDPKELRPRLSYVMYDENNDLSSDDIGKYGSLVVCQVMEIHEDTIVWYSEHMKHHVAIQDLKPIPITEELLIKACFEKKVIMDITDLYSYELDNFILSRSEHHDYYNIYWYELDEFHPVGNFNNFIKHFHHLQNIVFDLTGKELKT